MSGNNHREPGVLSAALEKSNFAEIICDNIHVSEQSIKIAKKCIKGLYAITDSINASGLADGEYIFAKNNIIKENQSVRIKKDGTLAGSIVTMDQTFKNLVNMNFSLEEAVELTSYNASKYLNIQNIVQFSHTFDSACVFLYDTLQQKILVRSVRSSLVYILNRLKKSLVMVQLPSSSFMQYLKRALIYTKNISH